MNLFRTTPRQLLGFDQANMKRYGFPWRFRMDRKPGARMELKGCTVYPFLADRSFTYGTDPHDCLDRRNTFSITSLKAVIRSSKSGRLTVSINEFIFIDLPFLSKVYREDSPDISRFVIDKPGVHLFGWPRLKRASIVKSWDTDGTPREYEGMLAYPYAARISLKRGMIRDLIEFSLFYCTQPPAPGLPYYAPIWLISGTGRHIKMDYSASS